MKDDKYGINARIFYTNNVSQLRVDSISQEIKRYQFLTFIQFVHNYVGNEAIKSTRDLFVLIHDDKLKEKIMKDLTVFKTY